MDKYKFKLSKQKGCTTDCAKTYFDLLCTDKKLQSDFFNSLENNRKLTIIKLTKLEHNFFLYDPEIYKKLFI